MGRVSESFDHPPRDRGEIEVAGSSGREARHGQQAFVDVAAADDRDLFGNLHISAYGSPDGGNGTDVGGREDGVGWGGAGEEIDRRLVGRCSVTGARSHKGRLEWDAVLRQSIAYSDIT